MWSRFAGGARSFLSSKATLPLPLALYGGHSILQLHFGSQDNFFLGKFQTNKDPDALAEFYQAEDLLRIIAIHPIIFNIFMDKVETDDAEVTEDTKLLSTEETKFNVKAFGMEISFELIQEEEEIDGEMKPVSFMRHERFIDWVPILSRIELPWGGYKTKKNLCKILLWDQTWTYGFKRIEDGTYEVYHHGEKFEGPWLVRLIVFFHQYYVLWAAEKHINGEAFGNEDLMDRAQEELACVPLHVFKQFIGSLTEEKKRTIETLKKTGASVDQIAKAEDTLQKLNELSHRDQSSIEIAKVPLARPGSLARRDTAMSVKMIPQDEVTRAVLEAAMKDGQTAVVEAMNDESLEFKRRLTRVETREAIRKNSSKDGQKGVVEFKNVESSVDVGKDIVRKNSFKDLQSSIVTVVTPQPTNCQVAPIDDQVAA